MIKKKIQKRVLITIPDDLLASMDYYAEEMNITKSKMIEQLMGSAMPALLEMVEIKKRAENMTAEQLKNLEKTLSELSNAGDLAQDEISKKLRGF